MADDKEVQEQTIADETVLKKYKEAGEIVNSEFEAKHFGAKKYSTRQRQHFNFSCFYHSMNRSRVVQIAGDFSCRGYRREQAIRVIQLSATFVHEISNL